MWQMGKFYEFFHMDADIGVKELGLVYMKVRVMWLVYLKVTVMWLVAWKYTHDVIDWLLAKAALSL